MYRVTNVLNHNAIIGVKEHTGTEYLIMGKGVGFGRKIGDKVEAGAGETIYSLQTSTEN